MGTDLNELGEKDHAEARGKVSTRPEEIAGDRNNQVADVAKAKCREQRAAQSEKGAPSTGPCCRGGHRAAALPSGCGQETQRCGQ